VRLTTHKWQLPRPGATSNVPEANMAKRKEIRCQTADGIDGRRRPCRRIRVSPTFVLLVFLFSCTHGFLPSCPFHRHFTRETESFSLLHFAKKSGTKKKKGSGSKTVAVNRIAYRNYEVLDTVEAGIALLGTEVKSIRDGKLNLRDGYVKPSKDGRSCTLHNVHVGKCSQVGAEYFQHEEKRARTLLVHRSEARKFLQQTEQQGMTVVPLKAYWNDDNKLKIQIALCRGKNVRDKRAAIQERDVKRETNRIIKNFRIQ
jgi:SsrA-binding protein